MLNITKDGKYIVLGTQDGNIYLIGNEERAILHKFDHEHRGTNLKPSLY